MAKTLRARFEDLLDAPPQKQEIVPAELAKPSLAQRKRAEVEAMTDELLSESAQTIAGALKFADIPFGTSEVPEEWVEKYGQKEAEKLLRLAQSGQMSGKESPAALKLAHQVYTGILKARATDKTPSHQLNVAFVEMHVQGAPRQYEEEEWKE